MSVQEFIINGVSRTTSQQVTLRLRAEDQAAAEEAAQKRGLNVLNVQPVEAADAGPSSEAVLTSLEDGPARAPRSKAALAVLALLIVAGIGVLVFAGPRLYDRATVYFGKPAAPAVAIQVRTPPKPIGIPQAQEPPSADAKLIVLPDLLVTCGIALAGLALVVGPGVALRRRLRPQSQE